MLIKFCLVGDHFPDVTKMVFGGALHHPADWLSTEFEPIKNIADDFACGMVVAWFFLNR